MKFHKNPQWKVLYSDSNVESKNASADLNFLKVTKKEEEEETKILCPTTGITLEEENIASQRYM